MCLFHTKPNQEQKKTEKVNVSSPKRSNFSKEQKKRKNTFETFNGEIQTKKRRKRCRIKYERRNYITTPPQNLSLLKITVHFFSSSFRVRIYATFKEYTCIVVSICMLYIHCVLSVRTHAHSYKHSATLKEY